jgi:DNA-binding NarL/FixJ family response regulator
VKRRVLIVDDHPDFRRLAAAVLCAGGFEIVGEAADAASGLAAVDAVSPDLVLLDIQLPGRDGIALSHDIALNAAADVVLISSREAGDFGSRLRDAPVRGFLTKSEFSARALEAVAPAA